MSEQVTLKQPQPFAGGAWPWKEMETSGVLGEGRPHLALALLLLFLAVGKKELQDSTVAETGLLESDIPRSGSHLHNELASPF